jgi:hypothetical protein
MFGTIRKHQKWLWLAIVVPTIITFVWAFGPAARVNSGARRVSGLGSINGHAISQSQFDQAGREAELHYFINTGRWPQDDRSSGFDLEREAYQWLLLVQKQEQLGIHISDDIAADTARQLVRPFEKMGITSPAMFIQRELQPRGIQIDDFERFIHHFIGVRQLIATVGTSGRLITPEEARELYERDHQELATDALFYSASNYLAEVPAPAPAALGQYYTNMMVRYAVPERVQVNYVRFNVTNYLSQAESDLKTNLNEMIEANVQRLGTNLTQIFPDAKTPEAARAKIREELIRKTALGEANKKAVEFDNVVFAANENKARPESFVELARTNGLTVEVTPPFDRDSGPTNLDVASDFTRRAFDLTAEEPFSQAILGRDGVYVLGYYKQLPREMPTLDQIHDRVVADYKHDQAMRLARQAATGFYQTLTNGLAQGSSFTNLCAVAKLKPVPLPPFSLATRNLPELEDLINLNTLKQAAFSTQLGKVSAPKETAEGSFILYVKAKLPVDQAKMQTDMPGYVAALRRSRQDEAFQDWFRREWERGTRDLPINRRPPGSPGAAS